jgi:hypothetical protein
MIHLKMKNPSKGIAMKRRLPAVLALLAALLLIAACDTAFIVGSRTVGFRSGEFIYTDGYLRTTYPFPLDKLWAASEKTLAELKASEVERIKRIATASFVALVQDEKVRISIEYLDKQTTAVSIMVGTGGNNLASQLIHDRLARNLQAP